MDPLIQARILEHLNTATLLLDDDFRVLHVNPAAEMLIGISVSRLKGLHLNDVITCCGGSLQDRLYQYLLAGQPYTEHEIVVSLPGSRDTTVSCTVTPIMDNAGSPAALLEIIELDRQIRIFREEQRLSGHLAAREMLRGLAHEIKNPLGGLRGAAQLLEDELQDYSLKEYTRVIIGEADRLHNLVDRLLGPSKRLKTAPLDIHEVLERVRNLIMSEASGRITVFRDYDPSIPKLNADCDLLIQAVLNIARNALQVINDGGEIIFKTRVLHQFSLGHIRHRLVAKASIIDNGPGISEQMLEKLFFPMVSGREGGTGLGLSIAQTLVNQHGGLIECNSRPGHTEFNVLLPINSVPP